MTNIFKHSCKGLGYLLITSTLLAGCDTYSPGQRAGGGALIGGGTGAAIGALAGGGHGAAIGALAGSALGAGVGYATTPNRSNNYRSNYYPNSYRDYQSPYSSRNSQNPNYNNYQTLLTQIMVINNRNGA